MSAMLLFILAIPILIAICSKLYFKDTITPGEMLLQLAISLAVTGGIYFGGWWFQVGDNQILNGQITSKDTHKGFYTTTVSCGKNCRTTINHYTKEWFFRTTVGQIQIKYEDWLSSAVYLLPDPALYSNAKIGDFAAKSDAFRNYVKGAKHSLFHDEMSEEELAKFPAYPEIYDKYKVNRVVGDAAAEMGFGELNSLANETMKTFGTQKGVNVIYVITYAKDKNWANKLRFAWLSGKINDVVVILGLGDNYWTDVFTYANSIGNEKLVVKLRDALRDGATLEGGLPNNKEIISLTTKYISEYYKRQDIENFKYLEDDIELPTWYLILLVIFAIGGSLALTKYFDENEVC